MSINHAIKTHVELEDRVSDLEKHIKDGEVFEDIERRVGKLEERNRRCNCTEVAHIHAMIQPDGIITNSRCGKDCTHLFQNVKIETKGCDHDWESFVKSLNPMSCTQWFVCKKCGFDTRDVSQHQKSRRTPTTATGTGTNAVGV